MHSGHRIGQTFPEAFCEVSQNNRPGEKQHMDQWTENIWITNLGPHAARGLDVLQHVENKILQK